MLTRLLAFVASLSIAGAGYGQVACQTAKLFDEDGQSGDWFASAVAVDGDVAVAGARFDDDLGLNVGSAFVFRLDGSTWVQEAKLLPTTGLSYIYGHSVAVSGDVIAVGVIHDTEVAVFAGSVYMYRHDGNEWVEETVLHASNASQEDYFGYSVALDGDYLAVGAIGVDDNGDDAGAVYIFRYDHDDRAWIEETELFAADGAADDEFGGAIALSGDALVVGAWHESDQGFQAGAAYVFRRDAQGWAQEQKLLAFDGHSQDRFGFAVDLDETAAIIGAPNKNDAGSAYVYRFIDPFWIHEAKLTSSDIEQHDDFGSSVAIEGDVAVVGAQNEDEGDPMNRGAAYLFSKASGSWNEVQKFTASDPTAGASFGNAAAMGGNRLMIGAKDARVDGVRIGVAYVFEIDDVTPALLTDVNVLWGSLIDGELNEIRCPDDFVLRTRSRFGFNVSEPIKMEMVVGVATEIESPSTMDVTIESRINQPIGTAKIRLRNWATGFFEQVGIYGLDTTETVFTLEDLDAADRVRDADGRIELSIKHVSIATFTVGFDSFFDWVRVVVE